MITFKTRKDLGFEKDDFEGFIVRKDNTSILQLHLYPAFYTVFWLGTTKVPKLWQCLQDSAAEVSKRLKLKLNRGVARYALEEGIQRVPFVLELQNDEEKRVYEAHTQFLRSWEQSIGFARYDMEGEKPLILWSDLKGAENSEIGFSSRHVLPETVMGFFAETSVTRIDSDELKQVSAFLTKLIG